MAAFASVVGAACSGAGPIGQAAAATVDGHEISRDDVVALADAQIAFADAAVEAAEKKVAEEDSEENKTQLESVTASREQTLAAFIGSGDDTLSTSGMASALTQLVQNRVAAAALRDVGGEVTAEDRESVRTEITGQLEPLGITDSAAFEPLIAAEVERRALETALQAAVSTPPAERAAQLQQAYDAGYGDQICLGVIGVADESTAQTALERLGAGEAVEAVAAELSLQDGGDPNACVSAAQVMTVFGPEALQAEVGGLVGPGESQGVFLVGKITSIDRPSFEEAQANLEAAVPEDSQANASAALQEAAAGLEVEVDPRFGSWDAATSSILPPDDPAAPTTTGLLNAESGGQG